MTKHIIFSLAILMGLLGCAQNSTYQNNKPEISSNNSGNSLITANYKAADALTSQLDGKLNPAQPLIVATLVNIDDLNNSSTFGRLTSEQVSARFTQSGFNMIEMKFRDFVYMKQDQGELLLTREIKDVAKTHNAQAVILGTYAITGEDLYVNLKVIQPNTNIVLAVHDYSFRMNQSLKLSTKSATFKR